MRRLHRCQLMAANGVSASSQLETARPALRVRCALPNNDNTPEEVNNMATARTTRARPRWARFIRHLGEDLTWALRGWAGLPRPAARLVVALLATLAAWLVGAEPFTDLLSTIT